MSLKTKQICPHCNSNEIGLFPSVTIGCANEAGRRVVDGLDAALYTCADCGFSEMYLRTPVSKWPNPPSKSKSFEWLTPPR